LLRLCRADCGRLLILWQRGDFGRLFRIGNGKRIVGIKGVPGGHAQHLERLDIHDDAHNPVADRVVLDCLVEVFFQITLNVFVDGKNQTVAVLRVDPLFIFKIHIGSVGILDRHHAAGHSLQIGIVIGFHARKTLTVAPCEAQNRSGKLRVRIIPLGVLLQPDGGSHRGVVLFKFQNFGARIGFDLLFDVYLIALGLERFLINFVAVHPEDFRKAVRNQRALLFGCGVTVAHHKRCRRNKNIPYGRALGHNLHIGIIDRATGGIDRGVSHLLCDCFLLQFFALYQLKLAKLCRNAAEPDNNHRQHRDQAASAHPYGCSFSHCAHLPSTSIRDE